MEIRIVGHAVAKKEAVSIRIAEVYFYIGVDEIHTARAIKIFWTWVRDFLVLQQLN